MNTNEFDYGVKPYTAQSDLYLNPLSIFVSSAHHLFHHHEHPAH